MSGGKKKSSFQITSVTTDYEGPGSPGSSEPPALPGPTAPPPRLPNGEPSPEPGGKSTPPERLPTTWGPRLPFPGGKAAPWPGRALSSRPLDVCGCLRERPGDPWLQPAPGRSSRGLGGHWGPIFGFQVGAGQLGPGCPNPAARPVSGPHLLAPAAPYLPWTSGPLLNPGAGPAGSTW